VIYLRCIFWRSYTALKDKKEKKKINTTGYVVVTLERNSIYATSVG